MKGPKTEVEDNMLVFFERYRGKVGKVWTLRHIIKCDSKKLVVAPIHNFSVFEVNHSAYYIASHPHLSPVFVASMPLLAPSAIEGIGMIVVANTVMTAKLAS